MLSIEDMLGDVAPLNDVPDLTYINYDLVQVPQLTATVYDDDLYHKGFAMIEGRSTITDSVTNQQFIITARDDISTTDTDGWTVTALHVLRKLNDKYHDDTFDGMLSADDAMKRIVDGTDFTYTLHDDLGSQAVSGFGNGYALDLFLNTFLTTYGAEFTVDNYHIDIYKQIGKHNAFVFVDGGNINKIEHHYDDSTITTHATGTGKTDENNNPSVKSEYTSPNSKYYGVIDAEPFQDDNITSQSVLDDKTKASVQDYPLMQLTCEFHDFEKGSPLSGINDIQLGNYGFIRDRGVIDVEARIVALQVYPESEFPPVVTIGNVMGDFDDIIINLQNNNKSNVDISNSSTNAGNAGAVWFNWTEEEMNNFDSNG